MTDQLIDENRAVRLGATGNMRLRRELISVLCGHIREAGWSQAEAARRLGVSQPRISGLLHAKADLYGIDTLVRMLENIGITVDMCVHRAA